MAARRVWEEPRWATSEEFAPTSMVKRFFWGLLLVVGLVGGLIGLGYRFSDKIVDRAARARQWQSDSAPVAEQLGADFRTYPELTDADLVRLKDSIAVVEGDYGRFAFELCPEKAPQTVQNFVWLAEQGFYDGQLLGFASPGTFVCLDGASDDPVFPYRLRNEFNDLPVEEGAVLLQRLVDPGIQEGEAEGQDYLDSGSTRFLVVLGTDERLRMKMTVFGKVVRGLEAAREMSLTFSEGLPDYAKEVLVYQVRVVPRAQLEEVFREPVEEPSLIPAGGDEGAPLPPG